MRGIIFAALLALTLTSCTSLEYFAVEERMDRIENAVMKIRLRQDRLEKQQDSLAKEMKEIKYGPGSPFYFK